MPDRVVAQTQMAVPAPAPVMKAGWKKMRMERLFVAIFCPTVVLSLAGAAFAQQGPLQAPNPAAEVAIAEVSNGCGGGPASTAPQTHDVLKLTGADNKQYTVNFRAACNAHDAGYSGGW